jgi:hypothetical protein
MSEIKLPFGVAPDGSMVSVDVVMRGLACDCTCPRCKGALVACQGEIVRHYFRHHVEPRECEHASETSIHLFAKQLLCRSVGSLLRLPDDLGPMISGQPEVTIESMRPDVLAHYHSETVAIEVWVAHQVPREKVERYATINQTAVEIDLRYYRHGDYTDDDWINIILRRAPRYWLVPPAATRKRLEEERQARIEAQRERQAAARAQLEEVARKRKAEEVELARLREQQKNDEAQIIALRKAQAAEIAQKRQHAIEMERHLNAKRAAANARVVEAVLAHWKREFAAPDLQELVMAHGTYNKITPDAWEQFDRDMERYRTSLREGWKYNYLAAALEPTHIIHDPACQCPTCGADGAFGYRDQNGTMVWYCERHRLATYWADARRDGTNRKAFHLIPPEQRR